MIKVVELFAGVGGFRLGLEGWEGKSASSAYTKKYKSPYKVVFSNQWEPSTKTQHANLVYTARFGAEGHNGESINTFADSELSPKEVKKIVPEHDLLVGGFPCQDYSVAGVNTKGIQGKKGVLWWNIHKLLEVRKPKYVLLENVDRLLKSPTDQRGRDFAIVLATMSDLGYDVEWRVINAAEYGMPQRRRRVFIFGVHKSSKLKMTCNEDWVTKNGIFAEAFPLQSKGKFYSFKIKGDAASITDDFEEGKFLNAGVMKSRKVIMTDYLPIFDKKVMETSKYLTLGDVLFPHESIENTFYVDADKKLKKPLIKTQKHNFTPSYITTNARNEVIMETELDKWKYLKGKKAEERTSSKGVFYYTEGPLKLADKVDKPSRTIITSEGGPGASRFKHLIEIKKDSIYRRLNPIELERLNMFPDDHTLLEGVSDNKRAFFMGNALVVGIVERMGIILDNRIKNDSK
ncbi:MAG: DNA (cytosine-5)-methyltransferase 1 [Glaciecola sp.]|jgi:DNA (cytosine-5)-methyltransferase 1